MLKIKKGLINILEENRNNNEPEEPPQPPQHVQTQEPQPQTPQQPHVQTPAVQPLAVSRQAAAEDWGDLLIKLLASAPADVAQKLAACIDREVLLKVLEKRDDPYLKVALLLISKK
jgi:hypothetical protein